MDPRTTRQEFIDQAYYPISLAAGESVLVHMNSHSYRTKIEGMTGEELDRFCLRGSTETPYRFTAHLQVTAPGLTIKADVETYVGAGPPLVAGTTTAKNEASTYVATISGGVKACRPAVKLTNNTLAPVFCECGIDFGGAYN